MSHQPPFDLKLNRSPTTTKQCPVKATVPFSLISLSESSPSPTKSYKILPGASPRGTLSEKSSGVPQSKSAELNHKGTRRAHSADTVTPSYLSGQWPKDVTGCHQCQSKKAFMCDKSAQTVDLENKSGRNKNMHRRSASFGQGDQLGFTKQHSHKIKEGFSSTEGKEQCAIMLPCSRLTPSAFQAYIHSVHLLPRHNMNRYQRNSVEGLNMENDCILQEIERLVSSFCGPSLSTADEDDGDVFMAGVPEGHRAPGPESHYVYSQNSMNTQAPSKAYHFLVTPQINTGISTLMNSPIAPALEKVDRLIVCSRSHSTESKASDLLSPNLERSCPFVREPPDGCEKILAVEETRKQYVQEPMLFYPVKPNQFVFKPSQSSAFSTIKINNSDHL